MSAFFVAILGGRGEKSIRYTSSIFIMQMTNTLKTMRLFLLFWDQKCDLTRQIFSLWRVLKDHLGKKTLNVYLFRASNINGTFERLHDEMSEDACFV